MDFYDNIIKIVVLGKSGVGKTSILNRYINDTFKNDYISTIGLDYFIKRIEIENKKIKVQIWDTAGQERFRSIMRNYYSKANIVILVYDLQDEESYCELKYWLDEIAKYCDKQPHIIILGNKKDLVYTDFKRKYIYSHYKISAKKDDNIEKVIDDILDVYINHQIKYNLEIGYKTNKIDNNTRENCCYN